MEKRFWKKSFTGMVAVAAACFMLGTAVGGMNTNTVTAVAEEPVVTTVVTSPFTAAVSSVKTSVVGVSNYQNVRYSNGGNYGFGFGFGFSYPGSQTYTEKEVLYATGSGVVISDNGFVLTNYHVVEGATKLEVTVGDKAYPAVLAGYDESLDVAVLMARGLDLPAVKLGDSDSLQVGDWAICIGNPLSEEFNGTVTAGIVSGIDRAIESTNTDKYGRREVITNAMIQTDAAINSGNSGGGMFSVTGELMGIPTMKYTGSYYSGASVDGIGLCIPINSAKPLIEEVLSGEVPVDTSADVNALNNSNDLTGRPRMGITISALNTSSALVQNGTLPNGVYINEVEEGGPAAQAGIQAGDIIVDVDDTVITSTSQLQQIIGTKKAGDTLNVKVFRLEGLADWDGTTELKGGEYIDTKVVLAVVDAIRQ